jgi:hypothetical protein
LEPNWDSSDDVLPARGCTNRYPTYNDYTV